MLETEPAVKALIICNKKIKLMSIQSKIDVFNSTCAARYD